MFFPHPQNHIYFERVCFALKSYGGQNLIVVTMVLMPVARLCFVAMATNLRINISVNHEFTDYWYGASSQIQND